MKAWWHLKAVCGYWVARRLFAWRWLVAQPRAWAWMQGQYARMAALGHVEAQSFYGHLLLFRGQGFGVRSEALRLLKAAGEAGDSKAAYQVGRQLLAGCFIARNRQGQREEYPLLSLSLGVVQLSGAACETLDADQLASLASEAKRQAKAIPGYSLHVIQAA